jgi:hypothetical protein
MKTIKDTVGGAAILIQALDDDLEVVNDTSGPALFETGIEDRLKDAYARAKSVIREIAEDMGAELGDWRSPNRPKQVEVAFNLGFSAEAGVWIVTGKGECALNVKMTWEMQMDAPTD